MRRLLSLFLFLYSINIFADSWVIEDIRVTGLQRVSAGSVFASMPVSVGDEIDQREIQLIAKSIFNTGKFDDIEIGRDGGALLINLVERPSIASIDIQGNKAIKTEALLEGLRNSDLYEGQLYRRSIVEGLSVELERQYVAQGRYGAEVKVESNNLPRNRVAILIEVDEGEVAQIKDINIVGNNTFTDEELLRDFELSKGNWLSFITNDNKYAQEKLRGDLESLESFYKNRGYVKFSIDSRVVSVSPDKKSVFITIGVREGGVYKVKETKLAGDLPLSKDNLRNLIFVKPDTVFSQELVTASEEFITNTLGNEGYAFAEVSGVPEILEDEEAVNLTFFVEPGQRTYVRRIEFIGNERTYDVVLRREMRQMEGAWASNALIENSKLRLERLGFFKQVEVETKPVPGISDQVDIEYTVEEEFSGSIGGSIGYGAWGLTLGANYSENNAFGTGNRLVIGINKNAWQTSYNFNFFDPYYTIDAVSLGYNAFYRSSDFGSYNLASYSTDSYGLGAQFGFPISEIERLNLNISYDNTKLDAGNFSSLQLNDFVNQEGDTFETYKLTTTWSRVTLNRGIFPTAGQSHAVSIQTSLPGSSLNYGKLIYRMKYYAPMGNDWVFSFRNQIGILAAYGDTSTPPFFEHFYAGGMNSVRGFRANTLGPRSEASEYVIDSNGQIVTDSDGNPIPNPYYFYERRPIGGQYSLEGGVDWIFPLPISQDNRSVRSSVFFDYGNVFSDGCKAYERNCFKFDTKNLRYSVGLAVTWITQLGPLSFAISQVFNRDPLEEIEQFQFEIGTQF
tara:strand:- start:368 stop:2743 length:2376 start_codon:yes stop_codon:yes gene_type:complete